MKNFRIFLFAILTAISIYGCKEDPGLNKPLLTDKTKPGIVSDVKAESRPGAAKLTYKIPADNDLLYIKAVYEIRPGVSREIKASYSNDSLVVDGFGEIKPYEVKLYAVDKGENLSDPVTITVTPSSPSFVEAFKTVTILDDFGGMRVDYKNKNESDLAIVVISPDKNGDVVPIETYYTKAKSGKFNIRGYDPKPVRFGVYVRDRFGNLSDTLYKNISPIPEVMLDRTKFKKEFLAGDSKDDYGWAMENIWDGTINEPGFHTPVAGVLPLLFTFDLGVTTKLSRFKEYQRNSPTFVYNHGNMHKFELWGTSVQPNPNGSWDNWVKLGAYESIKPSGLPNGQNTAEDIAYATAGEEFDFEITSPKVRWIRVKMIQNWSNTDFVHLLQIQFWGQPQQ
ncbi:DUF5000 domain-containing lipoprotein [Pedobacter panaciterrae]